MELGTEPTKSPLALYQDLIRFNVQKQNLFKVFQKVNGDRFINTPEIKEQISLDLISGSIPTWLNGIMFRIGPGVFQIERKDGSIYSIQHGLDGLPFIHRFEISGENQTIKYNSRLTAKALESVIKDNRSERIMFFGHFPDISFLEWIYRILLRFEEYGIRPLLSKRLKQDSQLIGVTATPNFPLPKGRDDIKQEQYNLIAKTDTNFLQKINPTSLAPEKVFSYDDYEKNLSEPISCAHHQFDPETGEVINFVLRIVPLPVYKIFTISNKGETTVLATITHRKDEKKSRVRPTYIHSFWMTKNYIIIPEPPLFYSRFGLNNVIHGAAIASMKWDGEEPTYFHIISRYPQNDRGDNLIASIPYRGFFHFHTANAFESIDDQGHTILNLDCASFPDGDVVYQIHDFGIPHEKCISTTENHNNYRNGIKMPPVRQSSFGNLSRYKLDLHTLEATNELTLIENFEFPRFNQEYIFKDYRYVYGCQMVVSSDEKGKQSTSVVKVDIKNRSSITHYEKGVLYSEPIFVKQPGSTSEDDGILITLANGKDCCYFVILNARDLKELSRFKIGAFNATTFHGSYVDQEFRSVNVN